MKNIRPVLALVCVLCSGQFCQGGIITAFSGIFGPAGSYSGQSFSTLSLNNDNAILSDNLLEFGTLAFLESKPIDVTIAVSNSGGTTEYLGTVGMATNETDDVWEGFRLTLGQGVGDNFVSFEEVFPETLTDSLDWDSPDRDVSPNSPQFPILLRYDPYLVEGGGGSVLPGDFVQGYDLSVDLPDTTVGTQFELTFRFQPVVQNVFKGVVPEPSTLIIWALLGALGVVYGWRIRHIRETSARRLYGIA